MGTLQRLIIGSIDDPHVESVVAGMEASGTVLLDLVGITDIMTEVTNEGTVFTDIAGAPVAIQEGICRGWIRRIAPAGSDIGTRVGSIEGAQLAARMALFGALVRDPRISWLSDPIRITGAENKIVQYRVAESLDIAVPKWCIAKSRHQLERFGLGTSFILKPLGPGNYVDEHGNDHVVWATEVDASSIPDGNLDEAPFIAQEMVAASKHLRIVTVKDKAWCASLDANELPIDWRRNRESHDSFAQLDGCESILEEALKLTRSMGVGYSSQDWIVDKNGRPYFIDLNPGGQWLFLPPDIRVSVSDKIGKWLTVGDD